MASKTTNLTRHDLEVPGGTMSASMMLSDTGDGHVMFSTSLGPAFSISTQHLDEMVHLLTEAKSIHEAMKPLPDGLGPNDIV